jgi:hypothetical protein
MRTFNRPRLFFAFSILGALISLTLAAQEGKTQKAFAGTWEGKFKGTVFWVLKIDTGSKISGTMSPGKVSVNDEGDITDAQPSDSGEDFPILNPKIESNKLSFGWKEGESDDEPLQCEMTLIGDGEADLQVDAGGHTIKPIRLKRK